MLHAAFRVFYSVCVSWFLFLFLFLFHAFILPHITLQLLSPASTSYETRLADRNQTSCLLRKLCSILSSPAPGTGAERPLYSLQWHFWQLNVPCGVGTVGVMNGDAGPFLGSFSISDFCCVALQLPVITWQLVNLNNLKCFYPKLLITCFTNRIKSL